MTQAEFTELALWVAARWPKTGWSIVTRQAFAEDLAEYDRDAVWAAVRTYYERGAEFPPHASVLIGLIREYRLSAAATPKLALPGRTGDEVDRKSVV